MPLLKAYAIHDDAPELRAAPPRRSWMDSYPERFAYRCLPLVIANAHGWEILCPRTFAVEWSGGSLVEDLRLIDLEGTGGLDRLACSHFPDAILTFHTGYLFRTEPGHVLMATGPVNRPKEGLTALTGIVESDWLPFPFTMNWKVTAQGRWVFERGEPFCTVYPVPATLLRDVEVEIHALDSAPDLKADMEAWSTSRNSFLDKLRGGDPDTVKAGWQRHYFQGQRPDGQEAEAHVSALKLAEPKDMRHRGD